MAYKQFALDESTSVTIYKRRRSRNIRLTVATSGEVRVSIPVWAPYRTGLDFARSRMPWIISQRRPAKLLADGEPIGKAHRMSFLASTGSRITTRLKHNEIRVAMPAGLTPVDPKVQASARSAATRALRLQAEQLLPKRLGQLAELHSITYESVRIKQLKSRWGSCDQDRNIVLSLYLMQLPWELIDYVLLHELTHCQIMRHGPVFWRAMRDLLPDAQALRKQLRSHRPVLGGSEPAFVT